eukprot:3706404-Pleurochrysis_carterae.AAC.1
MPSIIDLQKRDTCAVLTFPMCALGARDRPEVHYLHLYPWPATVARLPGRANVLALISRSTCRRRSQCRRLVIGVSCCVST